MKPADLNRFLIVGALVSDLYCPGYNPRQSLEKDSNLVRTASRYKLEVTKITTAVRADLSNNRKEHGSHRTMHKVARKVTTASRRVPHPFDL
jgi:hypothetical protein